MASRMHRYKVHYKAHSNVSYIIVQAQTRADARSKARVMLVPGAKIIAVEEL